MNRIQKRFVLDALEYEHMLTDWESEFINDLAERNESQPNMVLSDKQNDILNRISQKIG